MRKSLDELMREMEIQEREERELEKIRREIEENERLMRIDETGLDSIWFEEDDEDI